MWGCGDRGRKRESMNMWKSILAVWGSAVIAIGIAIYYTHDMRCLWFLLIPACISFRNNDRESEDV